MLCALMPSFPLASIFLLLKVVPSRYGRRNRFSWPWKFLSLSALWNIHISCTRLFFFFHRHILSTLRFYRLFRSRLPDTAFKGKIPRHHEYDFWKSFGARERGDHFSGKTDCGEKKLSSSFSTEANCRRITFSSISLEIITISEKMEIWLLQKPISRFISS